MNNLIVYSNIMKIGSSKIIKYIFFDVLFLACTKAKNAVCNSNVLGRKVASSEMHSRCVVQTIKSQTILLLTGGLPRYFSGLLTRGRMDRLLYTPLLTVLVLVYMKFLPI